MIRHTGILTFIVLVLSITALAQVTDEEKEREKRFREQAAAIGKDTSKSYGWKHNVVTGLNLTQVSFKDWAAGGENALAYTLWLKGASVQEMEHTHWSNALKLAFGQTRLSNQGLRKTDDEIYFESLIIYKLGVHVNPYAAATFRSQFAKGYTYDDAGNETGVSKFFDPAYFTQSIGVAYKPIPEITTRIGVAVREVITSDFPGYADDPSTIEIEKTKVQGGLESVTDAEWKFAENMLFTSKLELFAPFTTLDEIIVRSDNAILAKVNQYVTAGINVTLINDVTVTRRTQIKQILTLGLSYTLL